VDDTPALSLAKLRAAKDRPMTDEERARLYGPAAQHAEIPRGTWVRISGQWGEDLIGRIDWIRAPGPVVQGGRVHPTTYVVLVARATFPYFRYQAQILEVLAVPPRDAQPS
jgi:hypothetical protein